MPIDPLAAKWRAFGWRVLSIDGHDMREIRGRPRELAPQPRVRPSCWPGPSRARASPTWRVTTLAPGRSRSPYEPPVLLDRTRRLPDGVHADAFGDTLLEDCPAKGARHGGHVRYAQLDGPGRFAREFPDRHVEVGIAEQNLMTVAAGLAASGRTVFAATYATFASMRALEQMRTFLAYPRLPVVIVAGLGGLSAGIEGVAHLAVEDLGILRCIPDLVILNPADAVRPGKWCVRRQTIRVRFTSVWDATNLRSFSTIPIRSASAWVSPWPSTDATRH